jgi:hypothetical protein
MRQPHDLGADHHRSHRSLMPLGRLSILGAAEPPGFARSPRVRWKQRRTHRCGLSARRESSPSPHQENIMAQATAVSPQALLKAAKALVETYNAKDWERSVRLGEEVVHWMRH